MDDKNLKAIQTAVNMINQGLFNRADIGDGIIAYKVPSSNPNKYVIRIDIQIVSNGR